MLQRHALAFAMFACVVMLMYGGNVAIGFFSVAKIDGGVMSNRITAPVTIARDHRGVPHISAETQHDLFFAQGFTEASDRLFQMDLARRYAYGRLSELFGTRALPLDEAMRAVDIAGIARRQWAVADARTRAALLAFSAGVNEALDVQPLPLEFRMLLYQPQRWTPYDSIAVATMAALELSDSWHDVLARDDEWRTNGSSCYAQAFPLSDPRYDVTIDGSPAHVSRTVSGCSTKGSIALRNAPRTGSNAWAAGAQRTRDGNALIANDPHVDISIPGIWYVMDLRAPGFHAAGATLPGLPGIALGHNERVAWAATNAQAATTVLYRGASSPRAHAVTECFRIRFSGDICKSYYRNATEFYVTDSQTLPFVAVRWPMYWQRRTSISTLLALDRAANVRDALRALALYRGAPENFIIADRNGTIAYHLAGLIPRDDAWGRYAHPLAALRTPVSLVDFDALPHRNPSRAGILLSANNKMYGDAYPFRLSAAFEPPYRAWRIAWLLHARAKYDASYFRSMQNDTFSPVDAEIARDLHPAALRAWNGHFDPGSRLASTAHDLRTSLESQTGSLALLMDRLRDPAQRREMQFSTDSMTYGALAQREPWSVQGAVDVENPLSPMWYGFLRGRSLPGNGDEYSIHVQETGFGQGFRAVWDAGNWDAGGISIPTGESGEAGSPYYDDEAAAWIRGEQQPLPFSRKAVAKNTLHVLTLQRPSH
ncbi:MAG: penicillin acylase family protein [Candidatus Eremiobacteraeota bacterium]|nr:penicillin acylase family protein [Candidatus Eremiobacteraeota bacterium]